MKKIALTSLLAVFAAAGANAANVIDGNPLYMPRAGHFYSVTDLYSHSEDSETWALGEDFGFGVTDFLAVDLKTTITEYDSFDGAAWNDMTFGLTARVFDRGAWKADVYGRYAVGGVDVPGLGYVGGVWPDHKPFWDEDDSFYTWTMGLRAGYTTSLWTIAGHVDFNYTNSESFNWGDDTSLHMWRAGVDGQLVIDSDWNLVAGVEYTGYADDGVKDAGSWKVEFGVNYNIDATKFVGLYINGTMHHATGDWELDDGVGYGIKFGIDF